MLIGFLYLIPVISIMTGIPFMARIDCYFSMLYYFTISFNHNLERFVMDQKLLTVSEIARELRVPVSWIYGKSRERGPAAIPRIKVGKYLRFDLNQVMNWLKSKNEME